MDRDRSQTRFFTAGVCAALAFLLGCGEKPPATTADSIDKHGTWQHLSATPHPELRAELARIQDEQALPHQLAQRAAPPEEENAATVISTLFRPEKAAFLTRSSGELWPVGKFEFNAAGLTRLDRFATPLAKERQAAREALARPQCVFPFEHRRGALADVSFIDQARVAARLEAFAAAQELAANQLDAAFDALTRMFRLGRGLANVWHVAARLQAVEIRAETFAVVEALTRHPRLRRADQERLCRLLIAELQAWPDDRHAWIGDRAQGIHYYEALRSGLLPTMFGETEIAEFKAAGVWEPLTELDATALAEDEWFYLRWMRALIDGCRQPFFMRTALFDALRREQEGLRNTPRFPALACLILLTDVEQGMRMQSQERAVLEAWTWALAEATGAPVPPEAGRVNPLSGVPYRTRRMGQEISVGPIDEGGAESGRVVLIHALRK